MRSFLHRPHVGGFDEEDYVDADLIEAVFLPETIPVLNQPDDQDETDEEVDEQDEVTGPNQPPTRIMLSENMTNNDEVQPESSSSSTRSSQFQLSPADEDDTPPSEGSCQSNLAVMLPVVDEHPKEDGDCSTSDKRRCLSPDLPEGLESNRLLVVPDDEDSAQAQTETESYSNPLAQPDDVEDIDDKVLKGDGIGETTYSERNVLKILMKWIEELPNYSRTDLDEGLRDGTGTADKKLEKTFKKDMSLLWDMSAEPDVMEYLVAKGIFEIVRNTLISSNSRRLIECSLGILANVLSSPEMTTKLSQEDPVLKLISTVVSIGSETVDVSILLQVFAVLRRISWYLGNVTVVQTWVTDTLGYPGFVEMLILILKSSTQVPLIKEAVMVVFHLLEALVQGCTDVNKDDQGSSPKTELTVEAHVVSLGTEAVASALCEGLMELMQTRYEEDMAMHELITESRPIPVDLKPSLRSGLGALCFIQKLPIGEAALRKENGSVIKFLKGFFEVFTEVTLDLEKDQVFEYFCAGLHLLAWCQLELTQLEKTLVMCPILAAEEMLETEANEARRDSAYSSILDYFAELGTKFGQPQILALVESDLRKFKFLKPIINNLREVQMIDAGR